MESENHSRIVSEEKQSLYTVGHEVKRRMGKEIMSYFSASHFVLTR